MVVGNDVDGLLSALVLSEALGAYIIGFYDYRTVWIGDAYAKSAVKDAIWVDLDIYNRRIRSIGHHILHFRRGDSTPGHKNSLNPNILRGIYHGSFKQKYPLGTFHFLLWYFDLDVPSKDLALAMAWWPDSTWINGQSHRYRWNVEDWLFNFVPTATLLKTFPLIDTRDFERLMRDVLYRRLKAMGVKTGRGQVESRHLKLAGYQCQFRDPNESRSMVVSLLEMGKAVFGFRMPPLPERFVPVNGKRQPIRYSEIRERWDDFDGFLARERVFSYAIPNAGRVNYTTGIRL